MGKLVYATSRKFEKVSIIRATKLCSCRHPVFRKILHTNSTLTDRSNFPSNDPEGMIAEVMGVLQKPRCSI